MSTPWTSRQVRVKVSGYPDQLVTVRSTEVVSLSLPLDFVRRPVVLLRPAPGLFQVLANHPMLLRIRVKSGDRPVVERLLEPFHGQPVWIGCGGDVKLRGSVRDDLARDFPRHAGMLDPAALGGERLDLLPGDQIDVQVLNGDAASIKNDTVYAQIHFNVDEPRDGGGLPTQVETLYVDEMRYDDRPTPAHGGSA